MSFFLLTHRINEYAAMAFGISLNILLLYLILTIKKKEMKALSQMLIQNCVLDLIFSAVNTFPQPQVAVGHQSYYIVVGNYFNNEDFVYASLAITNFCGFVMLSLYALPVPFYLRYLVLCKKVIITKRKLIIPYTLVLTAFILTYAGMYWCYPPIKEHYTEFRAALNTSFWLDHYHEIPAFVATKPTSIQFILSYSFMTICIFISYSFVLFYALRISSELRKVKFIMSKRTKMLNKQLQFTLIIQAIAPFVAGNLPVLLVFTMIFLNYQNHYITISCNMLLSWVPVINPLAAMLIITPYRRKIAKMWLLSRGSEFSSIGTVSQQPATNNNNNNDGSRINGTSSNALIIGGV